MSLANRYLNHVAVMASITDPAYSTQIFLRKILVPIYSYAY